MDPQVRTRWTFDGLVEILVDATTAYGILGSVPADSPVARALTHTLAAPPPSQRKEAP